jgi:hypothetical protein
MNREKLTGATLAAIGTFLTASVIRSIINQGINWLLTAGWPGLMFGLLMAASGIYTYLGKKHNLAIRTLWMIFFLTIGLGLVFIITLGVVDSGNTALMIGFAAVTAVIYGITVGSTIREIYQKRHEIVERFK